MATNESDRRTDLNRVMQRTRSNASNSESVLEDIQKRVTQMLKRGTVLITGYSVLTGIDEEKLQTRNSVQLRPFSGVSTEDIQNLSLNTELSVIMLHVETNDSTESGIDSDAIASRFLNLKAEI